MRNLYHISTDPNLPPILYPRYPANMGEDEYTVEHDLGERVSFAPTIRQCAIAICFNIPKNIRTSEKFTYYVYKLNTERILKETPQDLLERYLYDYKVTNEVSFIEPCPIKKIGKIVLRFDGQEPIYKIVYANEKTVVGYEPIIEVVERYTEDIININGNIHLQKH